MPEAAKTQRPEILLITENKTVILEMRSDGKFSAKSAVWEERRVMRGNRHPVDGGPWFEPVPPPNRLAGAAAPTGSGPY